MINKDTFPGLRIGVTSVKNIEIMIKMALQRFLLVKGMA